MLVSPTEPLPIRSIPGAKTSSAPEKYGVDIFWPTPTGELWGVQRKQLADFVASAYDERLYKELGQMAQLHRGVVIIEGRVNWERVPTHTQVGQRGTRVPNPPTDVPGDTVIAGLHTSVKWTKAQHLGALCRIQSAGYWLIQTSSIQDTIDSLLLLKKWSLKGDQHTSLTQRKKPVKEWGFLDNRDWGIYLLQGFDGIGYKVAADIYDYFKGVPIAWTVTVEELMNVKGVGEKRAKKLLTSLAATNPLPSALSLS